MDDLRLPRTVAHCPVGGCPWEYDLTNPRTVSEDDRVRLIVPPPAGEHLRPAELAAAAEVRCRPRMAAAAPPAWAGISAAADLVMGLARDQDEAVVGAHLVSHTRAELAAALGDRLDFALSALAAAGFELAA